jgi:hypothetical protein
MLDVDTGCHQRRAAAVTETPFPQFLRVPAVSALSVGIFEFPVKP